MRLNVARTYGAKIINCIPYKIQIFLSALYMWTWIFVQINKLTGYILGLIMAYMPNNFIMDLDPKSPIKIIRAFDNNSNDITRRLKMFMNFRWDKEMCDDQGGVDLEPFTKYIGSSIIWIAYVFEYDININTVEQFVKLVSDCEGNSSQSEHVVDDFKKCINIIMVNTGKKIIHKLKNSKLSKEDILFGEVDFH